MMVITCCRAPGAALLERFGSCLAGRERQFQGDTKHGDPPAPGVPWGEAKLYQTPPLASITPEHLPPTGPSLSISS